MPTIATTTLAAIALGVATVSAAPVRPGGSIECAATVGCSYPTATDTNCGPLVCKPTSSPPPPPVVIHDCLDRNAEWSTCGTACPAFCGSDDVLMCTKQCVEGCFCREGFRLESDEKGAKCVAFDNVKCAPPPCPPVTEQFCEHGRIKDTETGCDTSKCACKDGEEDLTNPCEPKHCFEGKFVTAILECQRELAGEKSCKGTWIPPKDGGCCHTCQATKKPPVVVEAVAVAAVCEALSKKYQCRKNALCHWKRLDAKSRSCERRDGSAESQESCQRFGTKKTKKKQCRRMKSDCKWRASACSAKPL